VVFYIFFYGGKFYITGDPDPEKLLHGQKLHLGHSVGQFTEGDGRYPAAMEAIIKEAIQNRGFWWGTLGPRFFDYATSERCQDAFVSWLIAWAEDRHSKINEPLHRTGVFFLNSLLDLHQVPHPEKYEYLTIKQPYTIKIKRRYQDDIDIRIDILVVVNRDIVVLIEDKLEHVLHNPLEDYLDFVGKKFTNRKLVPVYLKTGDPQPHHYNNWRRCIRLKMDDRYKAVEKAGWKSFVRRDMLKVLKYGMEQGVENDTFRDFYYRLSQMAHISRRKKHY
jgi:PD-(D/E)XK nuclease superfamily